MKNLRILWGVKQEAGGNWLLREGPKLSTTLKKLKIAISTKEGLDAAFNCPSLMYDGLHTFYCELKEGVGLLFNKPISNHQHLHKLRLIGEIQTKLSLLLPSNLVTLELKDSIMNDEDPMAAIGALAHLKLLRLSNAYVGTSLTCDPGSFRQLEEFYLENFKNLSTWRIEKGAMNCLRRVEIIRCWKLVHFPDGLASINTFKQLDFYAVSEEFAQKARAFGWSQKRIRLPNNADAIIKLSDTPVDISSIAKLYEQLTAGIFLNGQKQKFWVLKHGDLCNNCFMVYALDLCVLSNKESTYITVEDSHYVECSQVTESSEDGTLVTVAKLKTSAFMSVFGKLNTSYLSPNVTYEIVWVIMLVETAESSKVILVDEVEFDTYVYTKLGLAAEGKEKQVLTDDTVHDSLSFHKESLRQKPTNEWMQVGAREFEALPDMMGDLIVSLAFHRGPRRVALVIKGFSIEPKL